MLPTAPKLLMIVYGIELTDKSPKPERAPKLTCPLKVPSVLKPILTAPPGIGASAPLASDVLRSKVEVSDAVITELTLMLCAAVKVSLLAAQLTASLTLMSPEPEEVEPWDERIVTLPVPSAVESVFPEISPEGMPTVTVPVLPDAIVKSFGSISQLPVLP